MNFYFFGARACQNLCQGEKGRIRTTNLQVMPGCKKKCQNSYDILTFFSGDNFITQPEAFVPHLAAVRRVAEHPADRPVGSVPEPEYN